MFYESLPCNIPRPWNCFLTSDESLTFDCKAYWTKINSLFRQLHNNILSLCLSLKSGIEPLLNNYHPSFACVFGSVKQAYFPSFLTKLWALWACWMAGCENCNLEQTAALHFINSQIFHQAGCRSFHLQKCNTSQYWKTSEDSDPAPSPLPDLSPYCDLIS